MLSPPMGQPLLPDVPNWSWHEYGMRAGFWRQFKALTDRNMPVTLALNASVCTSYPRVASAALEAGFEFMGHGFVQGPMHKLADQAEAIKRAVGTIATFTGKPVRSAISVRTRSSFARPRANVSDVPITPIASMPWATSASTAAGMRAEAAA